MDWRNVNLWRKAVHEQVFLNGVVLSWKRVNGKLVVLKKGRLNQAGQTIGGGPQRIVQWQKVHDPPCTLSFKGKCQVLLQNGWTLNSSHSLFPMLLYKASENGLSEVGLVQVEVEVGCKGYHRDVVMASKWFMNVLEWGKVSLDCLLIVDCL